LFVRATHLDPGDLRNAAALMLPTAVVLPLLPGHAGLPCPLRTLTGIPCPLCGMTTSVEDTVRLRVHDALSANPAGVPLVVAAIALLVLRPRRLVVPSFALPLALAGMWLFELHRFGFL
jgi:Protein of unknown function (DUF2752)